MLLFWLMGVVALSARLTFGWLGVRRLTRRVTAANANVQVVASRLITALRIRSAVGIVESALVRVPAVIGAFRPVVLLPAAAMSGLSMEQVEALLAHELAHVRRHDYLVNLLQSAVETLLFYHPAVWLVSRRVREERELCCDDVALNVCADRVAYASALADLESQRAAQMPALAATGGSLLTRIRRILGHDDASALAGRSQSIAGIAILAAILLLAGTQAARAKSSSPLAERRSEWSTTPQKESQAQNLAQGVVGGVNGGITGGVVGGVQGGVAGGVKGGVASSVIGGVVGGVTGGVSAGVSGGVQGGVAGGVAGGVSGQKPETYIVEPSDDEAKIVAGDEILLGVSSPIAQPQFSQQSYKLAGDGVVTFPGIGFPIKLAGLKVGEARQAIRRALIDAGQFANPTVEVSIVRVRSEAPREVAPEALQVKVDAAVYVFGEVNKPGAIESPQPVTVLQAIAIAGGQLSTADVDRIRIIRIEPATGKKIEIKPAKLTGPVLAGDTIIVPERLSVPNAVAVVVQGAVRSPGNVTVRAGRDTVADVIAAAGGFTSNAGQRIFLKHRRNTPDVTLSKVAVVQGQNKEIKVEDGDTITVEIASTFGVTGFVKNPGQYNWEAGMTLKMALALAGGAANGGTSVDRTVLAGWIAVQRQEWNRSALEAQNKKAAYDTLANVDLTGDPVVTSQVTPAFSSDRFVVDLNERILEKQRTKKEYVEVEALGPNNPKMQAVSTDIASLTGQLKGRLVQIVEFARQEYVNAKATTDRYESLYRSQEAQANEPAGAGALNRARIERKDPKTGKLTNVKLNKDPMTTLIEPNDVVNVPAKRM